MNTYKLMIETNLDLVALKNYLCKYIDVQSINADAAVQMARSQYGIQYKVELISIM